MKIHHTTLIGCGGIGSQLAEPLARLLTHHENAGLDMLFVDGDTFEAKNAERQHFPLYLVGQKKATAMAQRVRELGLANPRASDSYLSSAVAFAGLLTKHGRPRVGMGDSWALVVLAVDNDVTRRMVYDALPMIAPESVPRILILDAANEYETASVVVHARVNGQDQLLSPVERYANLRDPKDRAPGGGCMAEAPATPQLLVANMAAAFGVMLMVQSMLDGQKFTDDLQLKVRSMEMGAAGGWFNAP